LLLLVVVVWTAAARAQQAAVAPVPAAALPGPETLRVLNRDIVTFRADLGGASPQAQIGRAHV
jgi:hypothetical protein